MSDGSRDPSDLERAALALLRQRGYTVLGPEARGHRDAGTPGFRLLSSAAAFGRLADWAESSPPSLRRELFAAALPVLAHLVLALCEAGDFAAAQALAAERSEPMCALGPAGERVLDRLRRISTPADLQAEELHHQFRREERCVVGMSPLTHELLLSRMLSPDMVALADVFQRRVRVVDPSQAPLRAGLAVGFGSLASESADLEAREANEGRESCSVDTADPPAAFGNGWKPKDSERGRIPRGIFSASNVEQRCGLPLPKARSRARLAASTRFAELAEDREMVDAERLPSVASYIVDGGGDGDVNCMAMSCDGRYCVAGTRGARLWDLDPSVDDGGASSSGADGRDAQGGAALSELPGVTHGMPYACTPLLGHRGRVLSASFSPDGESLLTAGQDGAIRLWSMPHRHCLCVFAHHAEPVWAVDWCPVGHYFVSGGSNGEGLLWSIERASPLRVLPPLGAAAAAGRTAWADVEVIRAHPSARYAAVAADEAVVLWDLGQARPARVFCGRQAVTALAFSADGSSLVAGGADGALMFWDVATGRRRHEIQGAHRGAVLSLGFSWPGPEEPEESLLASGGVDGEVRLWRARHGLPVAPDGASADSPVLALHAGATTGRPPGILSSHFTPANLLLVAAASSHDDGMTGGAGEALW